MNLLLPHDTRQALGKAAENCESRSLFLSRCADPAVREVSEKEWYGELFSKKPSLRPRATTWHPPGAIIVRARLLSRLLVNLSGGVMENANVLLDRYGLPYVPGSAVKGCARRMALQALHDWVECGGVWPANDVCQALCVGLGDGAEGQARMLADICEVFGWVESDWKAGCVDQRFESDFAWACGQEHERIWNEACMQLAERHAWRLPATQPWKGLPNRPGSVAFLAAFPDRDPGLELDVLTPHHSEYYQSKSPVALDIEDPVPVFFPAVRAQTEDNWFEFSIAPLRTERSPWLQLAEAWLSTGLTILGLGAKTNAGYGIFDATGTVRAAAERMLERRRRESAEREEKIRREQDAVEYAAKEQARILERAARESERRQLLEGLEGDALEDRKIELLPDDLLRTKMLGFKNASGAERAAMVRVLRSSRQAAWEDFKRKAEKKKGQWSEAADAIRRVSKQLFGGQSMP